MSNFIDTCWVKLSTKNLTHYCVSCYMLDMTTICVQILRCVIFVVFVVNMSIFILEISLAKIWLAGIGELDTHE